MVSRTLVGTVAIGMLCAVAVTEAHVTRLEVLKVEPAPSTAAAGAGPFEKITGKAYGELDPKDPKNALITDIQLAPRNARGKVEYVATFALIKPIDMAKASGVLMYSVVNRGGGLPSVSPEGHVSLVSGWQGDVVPSANNQTIQVPVAHNADGSSLDRAVRDSLHQSKAADRAVDHPARHADSVSARDARHDEGDADVGDSGKRNGREKRRGGIPAAATGRLPNCDTTPFPGKPDATRICLKGGFNPALLYELQYIAKDPLVLGMGFAATRDINSFFRYEKQDDAGSANPLAGSHSLGRVRGQLAVRHVSAGLHSSWFQPGRNRPHRLGRQQPAHRLARARHEPALRAAGRHRVALRARHGGAAVVGGLERRAARPRKGRHCWIAAARRTPVRKSWRPSAAPEIYGLRASPMLVGPMRRPTFPCRRTCGGIISPA